MTKIEAVDRVNLCIVLAAGLNSTNLEPGQMLVSLPRYEPFHDSHQKTLAFRHRNETLDNFIEPRLILIQLYMWLVHGSS